MRETASNQDLLDAWRNGDELAAQVLFERYLARLTALARSRLSRKLARRLDPEDIVLSAWRSFFVAAANGRVDVPDDDNLWPLLVTLTLRKLSRQSARHLADRRSAGRDVSSEPLHALIASEPTPEQAAILTDELESLLEGLDETQRHILIRRLQGETQQEIASSLGCSERAVRRAMRHVRDLINERGVPREKPRHRTKPARRASEGIVLAGNVSDADLVIHKMVGQGGFGRVYRATRKTDGRLVAVKFLKKRFWSDDRALRSLLNELDATRRIRHPHIRAVLDTGRTRRALPFLVMEWVAGEDLAAWVAREQPTVNEIVRSVIPVAEAIAAAHATGIVHCDLKPTNVLRRVDGHVFLTDFGFAHGANEMNPSVTGGTAGFLAPEQVSSAFGEIGPHTDVYGLGALLYSLLTGGPPFTGRDVPETLAKVLSSQPVTSASFWNAKIPKSLDEFCLRCLEKEPAERTGQAVELCQNLFTTIENQH